MYPSIIGLNEVNTLSGYVEIFFSLSLYWNDPCLVWNEKEFGGVKVITIDDYEESI